MWVMLTLETMRFMRIKNKNPLEEQEAKTKLINIYVALPSHVK